MIDPRTTVRSSAGRRGGGTNYKPGSVVGDYVVIGAIGTGGMGTVYKVQHVITQRIEAMKLLLSGGAEPEQEQRFVREMQVQARLHHPNIAAVYNAFRYYDEFFLVMEFIEGESLEAMLERGPIPLATGIHYACQALFALGYAHAHGVVHRDIAPSNMLITPDGTVKLTDFGLAKTTTDIRLTHSGTPVGSPWYMSPEQVRGDAALDARSDIYSLGVILYEIATGQKPFNLASTFDVMRAHVELPPLPPVERVPGLPPALNEIILTAMAKVPASRFQSAEQFYAALEPLQAIGAPAAARAANRASAAPRRVSAPSRPGRRAALPVLPPFLRSRLVQTALGTAACGLALFGGYSTYSMVRVSSAAEVPPITPVKPHIPPPPDIALGLPAAPQDSAPALPALPASTPDPPAANHRPRPLRKLPPNTPAPERTRDEVPLVPEPPAEQKVAALPAAPVIPKPSLPAAEPAAIAAVDPLPAPEPPPADNAAPNKRAGNRLFRALHKVFRNKTAAAPSAEPPAAAATGPQ